MKTTMHKLAAVVVGINLLATPSLAFASDLGMVDWNIPTTSATTSTTGTWSANAPVLGSTTATTGTTGTWSANAPVLGTASADWNTPTSTSGTWSANAPVLGTPTADWNTPTSSTGTTGTWSANAPVLGTPTADWNIPTGTTGTAGTWSANAPVLGIATADWNIPTNTSNASTTGTWSANAPVLAPGNTDVNAPVDCQEDVVMKNPTYPDTKGHWGQVFICRASKLGIISGYLAGPFQGLFRPDTYVTRAELLKTVMKMQGIDLSQTSTKSSFKDVESNAWYTGYVAKAKELGIVEGYKDGKFRPHQFVNRAEAVKMILLASKVSKAEVSAEGNVQASDSDFTAGFPDVAENAWYANYVSLAHKNGVLNGKDDGLFHPSENMTRAEMVKVVLRSFDYIN